MFNWLSLVAGLISAAAGISALREQVQYTLPAAAYVQPAPGNTVASDVAVETGAGPDQQPTSLGNNPSVVAEFVTNGIETGGRVPNAQSRGTARAADAVESQLARFLRLSNVEFLTNSSNFTRRGLERLQRIATMLKANMYARFMIAGHTDSRGDAAANMALSEARARAVIQYLVEDGLPGDRFVARGFGATRPIADNRTVEGRQRNRRIEFMQLDGLEP
jgi:outer membrane protein OmpA-like peptidoglycan-associated protein